MKLLGRKQALATALVVLTILGITFSNNIFPIRVRAQSSGIDVTTEYSSGDVTVFPYLQAWYTWVSVNGTHMIFLALHSNQLPSPVSALEGQGYNASSRNKIFVANALIAMEIYNDTNHNGYLDANYLQGATELRYTLVMNASQTFSASSVTKTTIGGIPHYEWGVTYGKVQSILLNATGPGYGYAGGTYASGVTISHVTLDYNLSFHGNTSYLKTSYDIGNFTLVAPYPGVTLQGLSFSLLHTTLVASSSQASVLAGGAAYNSQVNVNPSLVSSAGLLVDNNLAFEFLFNDNYTLETPQPVSYRALYVASPNASLPSGVFSGQYYTPLIRVQDFVRDQLPSVAGLPATSDLNYGSSKLIYRICYPEWSGNGIVHDPTLEAHFVPILSPASIAFPLTIILIFALAGAIGIVVATVGVVRRRRRVSLAKHSESLPSTSQTGS